jgi:colanic acid biosynthesis glycosyl transferase WcaI
MRIQLWSYNYFPEPCGIAPLSTAVARSLRDRGHEVTVVTAHPHYPKPIWSKRRRPYRQLHHGVPVLRLPLWVGRATTAQRIRQELSYSLSLGLSSPLLPPADVIVAVSPSFPALLPTLMHSSVRRTPWVLWLQDILPDGAATTGLVEDSSLLAAARRLERLAYASASRIVVISDAFARNLRAKGVEPERISQIYNPFPIDSGVAERIRLREGERVPLLVMGNIGYTQGLPAVVSALEHSGVLKEADAELRIAGHGVAADQVSAAITSDRVKMLGLLLGEAMESELARAQIGFVTQCANQLEFNLPSKLMNYCAHGVPVIAVVNPQSETARLIDESGAGWVVDAARLEGLARCVLKALRDPLELARRADAARRLAVTRFTPTVVAEQFEQLLSELRPSPEGCSGGVEPAAVLPVQALHEAHLRIDDKPRPVDVVQSAR